MVVHNHRSDSIAEDDGDLGLDAEQLRTVVSYLSTERGHEIASRVIMLVENWQKGLATRGTLTAKWDRIGQMAVIAAVLVVAAALSFAGKFTSEVGIVLVALLGYALRKSA